MHRAVNLLCLEISYIISLVKSPLVSNMDLYINQNERQIREILQKYGFFVRVDQWNQQMGEA